MVEKLWHDDVVTPALLRHARTTYGVAMRDALADAGYDDIPGNGLYVVGGLAIGDGGIPIGRLVRDLRISKQAAGQLVDALVLRGYLARVADEKDRRRLIVTLTERGKAAAAIQADVRDAIDTKLADRVGDAVVRSMRLGLATLIDLHREAEQDAQHGE